MKHPWHRFGVLAMAGIAMCVGFIGISAAPAFARSIVFGGNVPGPVTCGVTGKIDFKPDVSQAGGGTSPSYVKVKLIQCGNFTDGNPRVGSGSISGYFSKSPLNCSTMSGTGASASLTITWRDTGTYGGPIIVYNRSFISSTGSQIETTASGQLGVAVPGSGGTATTSGVSYSSGTPTAEADLYFSDSPSKIAATCNSRHGLKKEDLTGYVTLSNLPHIPSTFTGPGVAGAGGITTGPDGNLWFANDGTSAPHTVLPSIGRITPSGAISTFTSPNLDNPVNITSGPDGNLWFTNEGTFQYGIGYSGSSIGQITPSGVISKFTDPTINDPYGITAGPDGNLWFTNQGNDSIGMITPAGVVSNFPVSAGAPYDIVTGPDGALWFTDGNSIGRITTAGVITMFPFTSGSGGLVRITVGPDGALWFTDGNSIGRITTAGVISEFPLPAGQAAGGGITTGPDGNLWFPSGNGYVSQMTPAGVVTGPFVGPIATLQTQSNYAFYQDIVTGPDGNIWFTESDSIDRISP
jgi:streptogramin lyase